MTNVERLDLDDPLARTFDVVANTLRPVNLVGDVLRHPGAYAARWGAIAVPFMAPGLTQDFVSTAIDSGRTFGEMLMR